MKNKRFLLIALLLAAALLLVACAPKPAPKATDAPKAPEVTEAPKAAEVTEAPKAEEKVFTLEELAKFNGKDGQPAYIAVDGVVYDVTNLPPWKGGDHNGYNAGKDLTTEIKEKSPHGIAKLELATKVGKLAP